MEAETKTQFYPVPLSGAAYVSLGEAVGFFMVAGLS